MPINNFKYLIQHNVSKLRANVVYKNFRELCKVLELDYNSSSSDSKNAILKELARYCSWKRIGHKYKITTIYKEPISIAPICRNKKSKYADCIYDYVIVQLYNIYLITSLATDTAFIASKSRLINKLGFAKDLYLKPENLSKRDMYIFDILRLDCINVVNRVFDRAIANLHKTKRLNCCKVFFIIDKKDGQSRMCTEFENQLIEKLLSDIKSEWTKENLSYPLIAEGKYYNYLITELNKRLEPEEIIYEKTSLKFALFDDDSNNILQLYNDRFGKMNRSDIELHLSNQKRETNCRILKQINSKNDKAKLDTSNPFMNYELSCEINAILDDFLEEDTESKVMDLEKATKKYRERRKELTKLLI
ncbi:MAG: hypothetical protein K2O35_02395 [Clostridia bacterium]|nr:hypothetical protein [Clostridia bacterium]